MGERGIEKEGGRERCSKGEREGEIRESDGDKERERQSGREKEIKRERGRTVNREMLYRLRPTPDRG